MKKNVFAAFLLVLTAMAFVACGTQNDPNALTGIAVTPASVSLVPGDELRLSVTPTPSAAVVNPDSVVWVSTDTSVVVINANGVITAVGYGAANVEATYGEFKSACAVKVLTYFETLQFNSAILLDVDTLALDSTLTVRDIEAADGAMYKGYLSLATLWVFSDGYYVNEEGMMDGVEKGSVIELEAPMYYAPSSLNPEEGRSIVFTLGKWGIDARDTVALYVAAPGAIDEYYYKGYMEYFVEAINGEDANTAAAALTYAGAYGFTGTTFSTYEYYYDAEKQEGGYYGSYIPDGIVTKGQFYLTNEGAPSGAMTGVEYSYFELLPLKNEVVSENSEYAYGCLFDYSEEGLISWNNKEIAFDDPIVSTFGELPSAEAQKMEPIYMPVFKIDYPEAAERLEKQLIQNNSLIRFKK